MKNPLLKKARKDQPSAKGSKKAVLMNGYATAAEAFLKQYGNDKSKAEHFAKERGMLPDYFTAALDTMSNYVSRKGKAYDNLGKQVTASGKWVVLVQTKDGKQRTETVGGMSYGGAERAVQRKLKPGERVVSMTIASNTPRPTEPNRVNKCNCGITPWDSGIHKPWCNLLQHPDEGSEEQRPAKRSAQASSKVAVPLSNEGYGAASVCSNCHQPIQEGQLVNWANGTEQHVACPPKGGQSPNNRLNLPPNYKTPQQPYAVASVRMATRMKWAGVPPRNSFGVPAQNQEAVVRALFGAGLEDFRIVTNPENNVTYLQFENPAESEVAMDIVEQAFAPQIAAGKGYWREWTERPVPIGVPRSTTMPVQKMNSRKKRAGAMDKLKSLGIKNTHDLDQWIEKNPTKIEKGPYAGQTERMSRYEALSHLVGESAAIQIMQDLSTENNVRDMKRRRGNHLLKKAGANEFWAVGHGKTVQEAFNEAVSDAQHEHGHGGYTGTIAEKGGDGYILFTPPAGIKPQRYAEWVMRGYEQEGPMTEIKKVELKPGSRCQKCKKGKIEFKKETHTYTPSGGSVYRRAPAPEPSSYETVTPVCPNCGAKQWDLYSESRGSGEQQKFYYAKKVGIPEQYVEQIRRDNKRVDDKWGPCGAVQVKKNEWLFFGHASS